MRSRHHMTAMLAMALGTGALGPLIAAQDRRREPKPDALPQEHIPLKASGYVVKPPTNGRREVARRLRQAERAAAKRSSLNGSEK